MRSLTIDRPSRGFVAGGILALTMLAGTAQGADTQARVMTDLNGRESAQEFVVENPRGAMSLATKADHIRGALKTLIRNEIVVLAPEQSARAAFSEVHSSFPEIRFGSNVAKRDDVWTVQTPDVMTAIKVAEALRGTGLVRNAYADHGRVPDYGFLEERARTIAEFNTAERNKTTAPGILMPGTRGELAGDVSPQGVADPDLGSQWHITNGLNPGRDNNITAAIYDTMGYTGAGINVGVTRLPPFADVTLDYADRTHQDIDDQYNQALSMPVSEAGLPNRYLTAAAGTIAAERNNGFNGHGVAPGAAFAELTQGTSLFNSQLFEYELNRIPIKVFPVLTEFSEMTDGTNIGRDDDFVRDSFLNALNQGRNGLGSVIIFSGGLSGNNLNAGVIGGNVIMTGANPKQLGVARPLLFYPEYYDGPAIGTDEIGADLDSDMQVDGNEIFTTVVDDGVATNNAWNYGPTYIMAQTGYYPLASYRDAFLINAVGEDGNADSSQVIGSAVFASVYSTTTNSLSYFDNGGVLPRGLTTTVPIGTELSPMFAINSGTDEIPLSTGGLIEDYLSASSNAANITAGIIALMLDANPNLSLRDIRHILFESIYESTRPLPVQFPNAPDFSMVGYFQPPSGVGSFWQANTTLIDTPNGTINVRHSDQYGFGMIDAEVAVSKAATWGGVPDLIILDSGTVTEDSDGDGLMRVPVEIADAEFNEIGDLLVRVVPSNTGAQFIDLCVRPNVTIEAVVLELNADGDSMNDIHIELTSPTGTRTNFLYPTTTNASGTTFGEVQDSELDTDNFSATLQDTALFNHEFTSWKHWGEPSGGEWTITFSDYGPDAAHTEGSADDPMTPEDETEIVVHDLGVWGVPGGETRSEKTITSFRLRIFGTASGEDPFLGCDPFETSCPSDLNGDGVVNSADLLLFLTWVQQGDIRADINNDGFVNFADISTFLAIFSPGFCDDSTAPTPLVGNRPFNNPNRGPVVVPF